jgi:uncharacterized protein (TIGR03437 family)
MDQLIWRRTKMTPTVILLVTAATAALQAQTLTTLETFGGAAGVQPMSITRGSDGNFYGTTFGSPTVTTAQYGTIYKITPAGAFNTLYTFCSQGMPCSDGAYPTGLTQGTDGNFYGATTNYGLGGGTIFKITPSGAFTILYTFTPSDGTDGGVNGNLVQGTDGNFYGESISGGGPGYGTIFKVTPSGSFTTVYTFPIVQAGGRDPSGGLTLGSDGNFYGTTLYGGAGGNGIIFKITPGGAITTLYSYPLGAGSLPLGAMTLGADGNFYGANSQGGANSGGEIFKITPSGTFSVLYNFLSSPTGSDGATPSTSLVQGPNGNFYGSTEYGGNPNGYGTLFEITPSGTLTTLYAFAVKDGEYPLGVALGTDGNLYGVTSQGGSTNYGTIFKLQLATSSAYTCTNTTPPVISSIDSASSYGGYQYFASGSWLEIKGSNMADPNDPRMAAAVNPSQWTAADFNGVNAPTSLDGISASINGKAAYVWYISPGQLNVQAPEDSTLGNVAITVTNCKATSSLIMFDRRTLAPGLLAPSSFIINGTPYLVATFTSDNAYVLSATAAATLGVNGRPAKPGDLIIAYGIGFGDVNPSILPGVMAEQSNALVNPVTVFFGSASANLAYAGLAGNFVGLYEFYITVPSGLANGDYQINFMQNGTPVPQTMYLTVQN